MSYLRHLDICNRFDPGQFLPLLLGGRRVGFIRQDHAALLDPFPDIFCRLDDAVRIADGVRDAAATTKALQGAADGLISTGIVKRRGEMFAVTDGWGGPLLFEIDRGLVEFFGVRAYAVHLNGWRFGDEGPDMWIARRAHTKILAPGKLDNIVGGGIGSGYNASQTLIKEAREEAGIPEPLAARSRPTGAVRFRIETPIGVRDEVLFLYDLELPRDFEPQNMDGEVEDFRLLPAAECLRLVRETDAFMYDVNLVLIDFAVRYGLLSPETPGYTAIIEGLHGSLVRGVA